jgi:alkylation response protein AidB-like acyl-CoA dehydrogenase
MDLSWSAAAIRFRDEVRAWLADALTGEFAALRGRGHLGDMDALIDERRAWERHLAAAGWSCLAWPEAYGGRGASLTEEILFLEEYARAQGPGRLGHIGEGLLGPTLIRFGTEAQKQRFLPPIVDCSELWCQGYSEPNAGSDLANVQTRAELHDGHWHLTGQKVWTSLAEFSEWCFVLARTDPGSKRHKGLSCLLVRMDQPGVRIVPIRQMTGNAEFCEVFFDGAVTPEDHVLGPVGDGWKVAMYTLAVERGASTLAQNLSFQWELERIAEVARRTGADRDPRLRERFGDLWIRMRAMRHNAMRAITAMEAGTPGREQWITKLYWATLHRDMGELALDVLGDEAPVLGDDAAFDPHRLFLWTRSDTIYAGTNQIQRNLIARRALGLPK